MSSMRKTILTVLLVGTAVMAATANSAPAQDGIRYATASVDSSSKPVVVSENDSAPAARPSKTPQPDAIFDDMTLMSRSPVTFTSLGLIIRNTRLGRVSVVIHDSQGRPVLYKKFTAGSRLLQMGTESLIPGVYIYSIKMNGKLLSSSFIVTH